MMIQQSDCPRERSFHGRRLVRIGWLLGLACPLLTASGCGGSTTGPSFGSEAGKKIAELVAQVGDSPDAKKLTTFFVKGSAPSKPSDVNRLSSNYVDLVGDPSVKGDTATAKVKLRDHLSGKETAPVEWSFVKEGDAWKIKSAPLP